MKTKFILLLFLFVALDTRAQTIDFEHFTTLLSSGPVPDDFTKRPSIKFNEDVSAIESDSKREQMDKATFLLESNYMLEDMLNSGRVIFGDPVTAYLNRIKDEILKDDAELKKNIRIYTLLSNDVNAFTFDNGIVLVTTGLVAQAQNEAQLAFVLCHEFIHYKNKHAITAFVENSKIERGAGIYASLSRDEEIGLKFSYAKDQESEADREGLEIFAKTQYSFDALEGVFDVLLYSYLPIDELEFNKNYFNQGGYQLPDNLFLDTLNSITAEEDYDDAQSTHPNIGKRKKEILSNVPDHREDGRKLFIQEEQAFRDVQKICRYQGCEIYLFDIEYEDALYQAYILMQEDSANTYLENVVAESLYGLSMYKNAHATPAWHKYYKKVEGQSQQLFYLFYKLNAKELNILALKNAWEAHLADPGNAQLEKICKQLGYELTNTHDTDTQDFFTAIAAQKVLTGQTAADTTAEKNETENKTSKYEKIKKEKAAGDAAENADYWKFAFTDYIGDNDFKSLFVKKEEPVAVSKSSKKKKKRKPEFHLGVDECVVVDPVYVTINERSKNPIQYVAAEQSRLELKDVVKTSADKLGLEVNYIDHSHMDDADVEKFNDMAILNRWIHEKLDHMDEDVPMLTSTTDALQKLAEKYGSDYFTWLGVASFTEKESYVAGKIFLCIYIPLAPFLIYDLITPDRSTYYFALVANAETGKFEMQYFNANKLNASEGVTQSNIYYILQQIKSDPK